MAELSLADRQVLYSVATDLRISNPQWLEDMVRFESGFNPKAKNPLSSARGLIQFIDSTARGMGYANSLDLVTKHPTVASQLEGPVKEYLRPYSPYNSEHQLYMAVFFPAARRYSPDTTFREIYKNVYGSGWDTKYARFEKSNPGIKSPRDYMNYVKKKPIIRVATKGSLILIPLVVGYILYTRWRK